MSNAVEDKMETPLWKKPDEVMQLHRLKRRKKALQERMCQPSAQSCPDLSNFFQKKQDLNFSRLLGREKRKNPFSKSSAEQDSKRARDEPVPNSPLIDESSDSTLFQLLGLSGSKNEPAIPHQLSEDKLSSFTNLLNKYSTEQEEVLESNEGKKIIPVDWALKTKIRFMSPKPFAWNQKLKASEEASGITGFVRCLDTSTSCTLDTSHHSRFHQHCLYWQHPCLPWQSLFPRSNGKVAYKSIVSSNEEIKNALHREWTESFRSLFQLVRARQCPYFYVCANSFTCLFRAAGINGVVETSALVTPTTRGLRNTLKQEEIEYTMPFKKSNSEKRKSSESQQNTSGENSGENDGQKNLSGDSCYSTMDNNGQSPGSTAGGQTADASQPKEKNDDESGDEDDMGSEQWLQSLGMAEDEIKKISYTQVRLKHATESLIDSAAESLISVQGVDAQALFNFLLNCKSSISTTGPFGGIPPTLLAPTAFQGGTLQPLKVRESTVHSNGGKYYSVELRGPVLPTTVHSLCSLLQSNSNPFSATFANLQPTVAFSKAAKVLADGEKSKENTAGNKVPSLFGRENLSDCGLNAGLLQHFCSADSNVIETIDSLIYSQDKSSYTWS